MMKKWGKLCLETLILVLMTTAATATECYPPTANQHIGVAPDTNNLTSPDYPNDYQGGLLCRWILIGSQYMEVVVNVTVTNLDIENSTNCENDSLQIFRKILRSPGSFDMSMLQINHRKRVANLCGKLQAPVTFLSEGAMDVFFITNSNVSMKGFRIEYTAEFDIDEDGREKGDKSDSWGLIVIAICVVVAGVLVVTVLIVCLKSRRQKEKPITFESPFADNVPKESGGASNG